MSGRLDAGAFFRTRFADLAPGHAIEIRPLGAGGTVGPREWFADPAAAAAYALALPSHWAVYYGVCPRRPNGGAKADVTSVPALWADVDDKKFPDGRAGALAVLAGFPLAPTWTIDSGGGLQPYWQLIAPLAGAGDPAAVARVEGLLRRLYAQLGGLDAVQDVSRVLRVPGTVNRKYDPPRPVTVLRHDPGAVYILDQFERELPPPAPAPPRPPLPGRPYHAAGRLGCPSPDDVAALLRHIPPRGDYTEDWLRVLAAVHSIFPDETGIQLCEAWSSGQPGEVARKFASFGRYRGDRGPAGLGTLLYLARRHGWRPARRPRFLVRVREVPYGGA